MKICPICETQYNDGSMRFCTKDGTPLIAFTPPPVIPPPVPVAEIPIETPIEISHQAPLSALDETLSDISIPSNQFADETNSRPDVEADENSTEAASVNEEPPKIEPAVVTPPKRSSPPPRRSAATVAPTAPEASPVAAPPLKPSPKRKSNAALFAVLAIFGVLGILGILGAVGAYWYFTYGSQRAAVFSPNVNLENSANASINDNSADLNDDSTNLEVNNDNLNSISDEDLNVNGNININANARPSPSPRTSPTPSPSPRNANRNANQTVEGNDVMQPLPTPIVRQTPTPQTSTPQPQQGSKTVSGGVVNGKATSLVKPAYPVAAKAVRAEGQVNVQVLIDENGNVASASAISGHPLLRAAAQQAARQSKFAPTTLSGQPVKVSGVVIYNFTMNQ